VNTASTHPTDEAPKPPTSDRTKPVLSPGLALGIGMIATEHQKRHPFDLPRNIRGSLQRALSLSTIGEFSADTGVIDALPDPAALVHLFGCIRDEIEEAQTQLEALRCQMDQGGAADWYEPNPAKDCEYCGSPPERQKFIAAIDGFVCEGCHRLNVTGDRPNHPAKGQGVSQHDHR